MNHKFACGFSINFSTELSMLALLAIACAVSSSAGAQASVERIAGEVVALDGSDLRLKSSDGRALNVRLAANVRFSGRSAAMRRCSLRARTLARRQRLKPTERCAHSRSTCFRNRCEVPVKDIGRWMARLRAVR